MIIWVLKDGETMPIQDGAGRMRTWRLAEAAAGAGHQVIWWSSTHSHQKKERVAHTDTDHQVAPGFILRLLEAGAYRKNISLSRVLHHARLARRFTEFASQQNKPDVIVASYPIIGFAQAAIDYGKRHGIPVIVDVRDPWPDAFRTLLPSSLKGVGRLVEAWFGRKAKACLAGATGIVAVSQGFLDWALSRADRAAGPTDRVFHIGNEKVDMPAGMTVTDVLPQPQLSDKMLFTFVGSFGYAYQLDLVCRVAERLHRNGESRCHFLLAGDGMQRELVEDYAGRLPNLTYLGWLSGQGVREVLSVSDFGLAPCNVMPGCIPNKVCEYLAAGLPIINSTTGDFARLLGEYNAGRSYAPSSADQLYACVREAVDARGHYATFEDGAQRLFKEHFVAHDIYADYVTFLERVAQNA